MRHTGRRGCRQETRSRRPRCPRCGVSGARARAAPSRPRRESIRLRPAKASTRTCYPSSLPSQRSRRSIPKLLMCAAACALTVACGRSRAGTAPLLEPPGRDSQARIDGDTAVLVNGRRVTPAGRVLRTQSYAWGLALSPDGTRLFVVDQFNYRLVTVDVESRKVVRSVRVGRNPFAVTLSPDERFAWVSNVGMFEFPLVPGVTRETRAERGLPFPAYGLPSKEAEEGVAVGGVRVPGLGSPNHPD